MAWTLTGFHNETGWTFTPYVFLLGLLMAQYTYTGYDASAHVAEETHNAAKAAPRGIVTSVAVSLVGGFILLYSITAAITDQSEAGLTALAATDTGLPPAQIFLDSLNSPTVAKFLLFIVCVAQFFCGMASVTANSRMSYAFSRDRALPGSRLWSKVNSRTGTPTNSIWLCVCLSIVLASPAIFNVTAYLAVTSIAVIGLYIAYVVPVFLRRVSTDFTPGPWNLGRWSPFIGWVAVVWVVIICILFVLPPASPVTVSTFNYAPIAVVVVLIFAFVSWFAGRSSELHARCARNEHTATTAARSRGEPGLAARISAAETCRWPTGCWAPVTAGTPSRMPSNGWPRRSGWASSPTAARCRRSASWPRQLGSPGPPCARRSPRCAAPAWCRPCGAEAAARPCRHRPDTPGDSPRSI